MPIFSTFFSKHVAKIAKIAEIVAIGIEIETVIVAEIVTEADSATIARIEDAEQFSLMQNF